MGKAQMKMFETISILVVFFLLLGIGLVLYTAFQKDASQESISMQQDARAARTARMLISLPEIQCSEGVVVENCIDIKRAEAFKEYLSRNPGLKDGFYFDLFGHSKISVYWIYPATDSLDLYEKQLPGSKSKTAIQYPVAVYDPVNEKSDFGYLEVFAYER